MMSTNFTATSERPMRRYLRGQTAIELAVLAPILGLVLLAAADFARVFAMIVSLNNAARAGVQYGAQSTITAADFNGIKAATQNDDPSLALTNITVSQWCDCAPGGNPYQCTDAVPSACGSPPEIWTYIEVDTQGTFQTLIKYPGIPQTTTMTGKAIMRAQ